MDKSEGITRYEHFCSYFNDEIWHFVRDCPQWPSDREYTDHFGAPPRDGRFCALCKKLAGNT